MKKIFGILMSALLVFGLAACSDDDAGEQYLRKSELKVVSSDVLFKAAASDSGRVVVSAPEAITAKTDAQWANATVSGDTVKVSVTNNAKVEGRASVLTIYSGQDSVNVTIQQEGLEYSYNGKTQFIYNDSTRSFTLTASSLGADVTAETPDWMTATVDGGNVTLNLAENNSGHIRRGDVYLQCGPYKDTVNVIQGELKDIINKQYKFIAYDLLGDGNSLEELKVEKNVMIGAQNVTQDGRDYTISYMYFADDGYIMPFNFDQDNLASLIIGGVNIGNIMNTYYLYTAIVDPEVLTQFAQNQSQMSYMALMASDYMDMYGLWDYLDEIPGNYMATYADPNNFNNWMGQIFEGLTAYNGSMLGIFAFQGEMEPWINSDYSINTNNLSKFISPMNVYAYVQLEEQAAGGAKKGYQPTVLRVSNANGGHAQLSQSKFLQLHRSLKAAGVTKNLKGISGKRVNTNGLNLYVHPTKKFSLPALKR